MYYIGQRDRKDCTAKNKVALFRCDGCGDTKMGQRLS
jgi:hypothetical protein